MKAKPNRTDEPQFNCEIKKQNGKEIQLEADVKVMMTLKRKNQRKMTIFLIINVKIVPVIIWM